MKHQVTGLEDSIASGVDMQPRRKNANEKLKVDGKLMDPGTIS